MASRLKCGLLAFAVGFSFYFFMKYYVVSMSDVRNETVQVSEGSDRVVYTRVPIYSTVTTINDSFAALSGNESCRNDILGTPPFVSQAGCKNGECDIITCKRLLAGDENAVASAIKFTDAHQRKVMQESEVLKNTLNCEEFRKHGGYRNGPVRPSDAEFPIAFSILVHWHLEQFERLLRAIYRPQNVYCVHVDAKTSWTFHSAIAAIAKCLPNVYIATRRQFIVYAGFSRLQVRSYCFIQSASSSSSSFIFFL